MTAVAKVRELLGGEAVIGPLRTDMDVVRLVRRGLPTQAVDHFLTASNLPFHAMEPRILARRTFRRRQAAAQPLDPAESDRVLRLVQLVAAAEETFGDPQKARTWLSRANSALDGATPLSLADTGLGARRVETLLARIAHGLAA